MEHVEHLNSTPALPLSPSETSKSSTRHLVRLAALVGVLISVLAAAAVGYIWFSGGDGRASAVITAPSLELPPGDTRSLFSIAANTSEARFIIDELLIGQPTTVVGVTNDVAGDMLIDLENPSNSVLGTIQINMRTLHTDNEFRNRALRGQILQSDRPEYEFATFMPVALAGLPDTVTVGETYAFQIIGSLNLHGVSRDVTFDAMVTPISPTQIEGTASAVIFYRDFNISIPKAPGVADISDDLGLEIDFTAETDGS